MEQGTVTLQCESSLEGRQGSPLVGIQDALRVQTNVNPCRATILRQGVCFPDTSLRPDIRLTFASTFSSEMGETSEKATMKTSVCG